MTARRQIAVAAAAVAFGAAAHGTPAWAHTMTADTARATTTKAGRQAARQTKATSSRVVSCRRRSAHQQRCKVALRYRRGAPRCLLTVRVFYRSHASKRPGYAFGQTVCS